MGRTHVVLADDVIRAIDTLVGQRGRSRFLEQAAKDRLQRLALDRSLGSSEGILTARDYPEFEDTAAIAAWVRAQRRTEGAS